MWIVFFNKFKKLFSTENIIETTKARMNEILADMNRNTYRNVGLIDQKIKELKAAVAEVDRHMAVSRQETEKLNAGLNLQKQMDQMSAIQNKNTNGFRDNYTQRAVDAYRQNSAPIEDNSSFTRRTQSENMPEIQENSIVSPLEEDIMLTATREQMALNPNSTIVGPTGTQFTVQQNGASYASVPIVNPQVTFVDNLITNHEDFASQVLHLHQMGFDVSMIASKLNRTITEVQFVIDMSL